MPTSSTPTRHSICPERLFDLRRNLHSFSPEYAKLNNSRVNREHELGIKLSQEGRGAEALFQFDKALQIVQSTTGKNSRNAARVMCSMARTNMNLGNYDVAIDGALGALEIFAQTSGEESAEFVDTLMQLSVIYARTNDFDNAASCLDRGLTLGRSAIQSEKFDPSQKYSFLVEEFDSARILSSLYRRVGNIAKAESVSLEVTPPPKKEIDPR